jgi:hypothetical protein
VSHDPSRKHFFAKLLGLVTAAGIAPALLAKSTGTVACAPAPATPAIKLRPAPHTVARRADSL